MHEEEYNIKISYYDAIHIRGGLDEQIRLMETCKETFKHHGDQYYLNKTLDDCNRIWDIMTKIINYEYVENK